MVDDNTVSVWVRQLQSDGTMATGTDDEEVFVNGSNISALKKAMFPNYEPELRSKIHFYTAPPPSADDGNWVKRTARTWYLVLCCKKGKHTVGPGLP